MLFLCEEVIQNSVNILDSIFLSSTAAPAEPAGSAKEGTQKCSYFIIYIVTAAPAGSAKEGTQKWSYYITYIYSKCTFGYLP